MGQTSTCCMDEQPAPETNQAEQSLKLQLLERAKASGKVFEYAKDIVKYVVDYEGGFYYVYHNNSELLRLEEQLELNIVNLHLDPYLEGATKLKVIIPPQCIETIHFQRSAPGDVKLSVSQLYSLVRAAPGGPVSPQVRKDVQLDVRQQAMSEGERADYGHIRGGEAALIYKFAHKHPAGCTFLYQNNARHLTLHETLKFEFINLAIEGGELEDRLVHVVAEPGQEVLVSLVRIDSTRGFTMRVEAEVTFSPYL